MSTEKRRGGYLATAAGVKKLKEAKSLKKYTYEQIKDAAQVRIDQVKRLFNPQWGDGKYKIGEEAVSLICGVLELKPEEIVSNWYLYNISNLISAEKVLKVTEENKFKTPYQKALNAIEYEAKHGYHFEFLPHKLDLKNMELTELPPEIGQLSQLRYLDLSNNRLSTLPSEIEKLVNLEYLDIGGNYKLNSLPSELGKLTNLKRLYLNHNALINLPKEISRLTKLERLKLYHNSFKSIPAEIFKLKNLTRLSFDNNSVSSLPSDIGQLTKLEKLSFSGNSISNLPPEIGRLKSLRELSIGQNLISHLPPEVVNLTSLDFLNISYNSISNLPVEIGDLKNLTVLYVSNNSLTSLPQSIKKLTNLQHLLFDNNHLSIPPEVLKNSDDPFSIINYYFSLEVNLQKPLHEAKMLLVGQGNVGKTCVRERLIRNQYDPKRNKTDGIDIESWNIEIKQFNYQINVWDFGGQEIMHSTHQFFLTKRSLYLLVIDTTLGEEENRIEYWLKIIQCFGKDSPVIIVGNKADQHPLDIDQRGLQNKYPQIKGFYETSCNKDQENGIAELKAKLTQEIIQLEHIDDQLPLPWFNVKQKLEDLDKDFIPYHKYESLCESEEIDQSDNQRILIRLLNDLGIILNFHEDPRLNDTHVLNPDWVTNGVYQILNDHQLIVNNKGILELSMLQRILNRQRYPTSKHLFIIDMMRKFELCFNFETDQKFLIPDIVPKGEPDTGDWDNTLAFEYHYPVLPGSIISRFIVRMNQWISQQTYWRNGVVLKKEGNRALVKADREDKKIIIRVSGKENTRRNLLTAIRSHFDHIHDTIPGIVPDEKVPLLDYPYIPPVDYQWLLDLDNKNIRTIIPTGLTEEIDIKKLLNGISSEEDRLSQESDHKSKYYSNKIQKSTPKKVTKEVFISYSWKPESKKITDELDAAFQAKGITIIRDIRDAGYKAQISEFMESIGRGKCVIVVISKAYLESENCMFELLQIFKNGQFRDRIFPIVLDDAQIYDPIDRIQYVEYWEGKIKQLDEAIKRVSAANLHGFTEDINLYTEIRNNLPQLTNILKDLNSLTVKIHSESEFSAMIEAVTDKLQE